MLTNRSNAILIALFSLLVASCAGGMSTTPALNATSNGAGTSDLSPALPATERLLMQPVVAGLRPQDRTNVVYFAADGSIHANRPELLAQATSANVPAVATPTPNPANFTGPFFRRNANWAFSAETATVTIPSTCADTHVLTGETADYYLGGATFRSKTPQSNGLLPQIDEVDAGLQMSPHTFGSGSQQQPMSLQLFMTDAQTGHRGVLVPSSDAHGMCDGQPFTLTFYVSSPTQLTLNFSGDVLDGVAPLTMVLAVNSAANWSSTCSLCILKRVISIALPKGSATVPNGTYFGITGSAQPAISVANAELGTSSSSITTPWPTSYPNGIPSSTSPYAAGSPYVCVTTSSPGNDLVGIDWQLSAPACTFAP